MATKRMKRTKRAYVALFDNPTALFGNGPDNPGVEAILYPNGERELWIKDARGHGVCIRASAGPAGFGLTIRTFGDAPMTIASHEGRYIELVQYNSDERSQAFARWYAGKETDADIAILGENYRRAPIRAREEG